MDAQQQYINHEDFVDTTAVFGEIKRTVFSKNFLGGSIANFFGVTKIDFTEADINGTAVINISQAFAEVKVKIPADWHVVTDVTSLFAVVDDKRIPGTPINRDKTLMFKGLSFFANIKIYN